MGEEGGGRGGGGGGRGEGGGEEVNHSTWKTGGKNRDKMMHTLEA